MKSLKRFVALLVALVLLASVASAEIYVYVLCNPSSWVNIHSKPSKRSETIAYAFTGDKLYSDCEYKNGYIHVIDLASETTEGWVSEAYIVYDEPTVYDDYEVFTVCVRGRVAVRKTVDGQRSRWLKNGAKIKVYAISNEWAVTNYGFVMTEFLEAMGD